MQVDWQWLLAILGIFGQTLSKPVEFFQRLPHGDSITKVIFTSIALC
jgi:hypothetical protein